MLHTGEAELAVRLGEGYSAHLINEHEVAMGVRLLDWLAGSQRIPARPLSVCAKTISTYSRGQPATASRGTTTL